MSWMKGLNDAIVQQQEMAQRDRAAKAQEQALAITQRRADQETVLFDEGQADKAFNKDLSAKQLAEEAASAKAVETQKAAVPLATEDMNSAVDELSKAFGKSGKFDYEGKSFEGVDAAKKGFADQLSVPAKAAEYNASKTLDAERAQGAVTPEREKQIRQAQGLDYKSNPIIKYEFAQRRANYASSKGDHKQASLLMKEADDDTAGSFLQAIFAKDAPTVTALYNLYPNGHQIKGVTFGDKGDITIEQRDGTPKTITQMDAAISALAKASPEKAMTLFATKLTKDQQDATRAYIAELNNGTRRDIAGQGNQLKELHLALQSLKAGGRNSNGSSSESAGNGGADGSMKGALENAKYFKEFIPDSGLAIPSAKEGGAPTTIPREVAVQQANALYGNIVASDRGLSPSNAADLALKMVRANAGDTTLGTVNVGGKEVPAFKPRASYDAHGNPIITVPMPSGDSFKLATPPGEYARLTTPSQRAEADIEFAGNLVKSGTNIKLMNFLTQQGSRDKIARALIAPGGADQINKTVGAALNEPNLATKIKVLYATNKIAFPELDRVGGYGDYKASMEPLVNTPNEATSPKVIPVQPQNRNRTAVSVGRATREVAGDAVDAAGKVIAATPDPLYPAKKTMRAIRKVGGLIGDFGAGFAGEQK